MASGLHLQCCATTNNDTHCVEHTHTHTHTCTRDTRAHRAHYFVSAVCCVCKKPSKFICPTCKKLGLPPSCYCGKKCFKGDWKEHKKVITSFELISCWSMVLLIGFANISRTHFINNGICAQISFTRWWPRPKKWKFSHVLAIQGAWF